MITMLAGVSGRFGINPKEAERFLKFVVVGAIGFIVDFGVFNLLVTPATNWMAEGNWLYDLLVGIGLSPSFVTTLGPTIAASISFVAAVTSNFLWNRYWTYPDSRGRRKRLQFTMFALVSIAGILIRIPIITIAHPLLRNLVAGIPALRPYADRLGANLALAISVVVVMFWNFFANRYWTYNNVSDGRNSLNGRPDRV
jgi:putative flippase GtrA